MPQNMIKKYGMIESRERLEKHGFHPAVTSESLKDVLESWERTMHRDQKRPTAEEFWAGQQMTKPPLTLGFLFMSPRSYSDASECAALDSDGASVKTLEQILTHLHTGPQIIDRVLKSGRKNMTNLALTSHRMWHIVSSQVTIWDSVAGSLNKGSPSTFVSVAPAYTISDILSVRVDHPYGIYTPFGDEGAPHPDKWKDRAIEAEGNIMRDVLFYKRTFGSSNESQKPEDFESIQEKVWRAIRALKPFPKLALSTGYMWEANQFLEYPKHMPFQPTMVESARRLRDMMSEIFRRRTGIRVLQFYKTQLLDRRILAVILRACPNVEMVGIYDCPLIHFGDVICLLDLIHEINETRRPEKPQIKALDFYPHFEKGMLYQHSYAATYGLTWQPNRLDIVQRGFFQIIMEAFLKARAIGLELLFSSNGSFVDFLRRVPNSPYAVTGFLDALHRYVNLDRKAQDYDNQKRQAMYDILKPARVGLECVSLDWPDWYIKKMGDYPLFCSSCGYETFQAFFTEVSKTWGPLDRTCSKCLLRNRMDEESDHLKQEKKMILTRLFRRWKPEVFNKDAPILPEDRSLMSQRSGRSDRPPSPGMYIDGQLKARQCQKPLVRDKRFIIDSVQNLPRLSSLVEGPGADLLWKKMALVEAHNVDLYSHTIRQLGWDDGMRQTPSVETPSFAGTRVDGAFPDHPLEYQHPRQFSTDVLPSFDNNAALNASGWMFKFGW